MKLRNKTTKAPKTRKKAEPTAEPKPKRHIRWWLWLGLIVLLLAVLPILQVAYVRFFDPPLTPLMLVRQAEARVSGKGSRERHYQWLPAAQIPHDFLKFVLTAEDQRFFQHHGFDWKEIEAARAEAKRTGKPSRGASTISMQCARSLFLWQGRSWIRKGLETYYTFWMETMLSKRRILELYANVIEMGDGVYGIEAAAHAYFHTGARSLTREQCAALAAILPNPREWNPHNPSPKLAKRIAKILRQEKQVRFPLSGPLPDHGLPQPPGDKMNAGAPIHARNDKTNG
jgi:monofunctional glycosyltransferase